MSTGPLFALRLDRRSPLGLQLERHLRDLIRAERLRLGAELPSTRALAADLGVSRGVVVAAYAQLATEGYISVRRGAAPVVATEGRRPERVRLDPDVPVASARFNLRPDLPDLRLFPRADWVAATRRALARATHLDLAYGVPNGPVRVRTLLAEYLGRTRGVVAAHDRTRVHAGSSQALFQLATLLRARGASRIAVEDPGHRWRSRVLRSAGLELVPVPVDAEGLRVDLLPDVDGVVVSPAHHFPSGVSLSPERRRAL